MSIQATGIGHGPNSGTFPVGLWANFGLGLCKGNAIGCNAKEGEALGFIGLNFGGEEFSAFFDFSFAEFVGAGRGAWGHVGDAIAQI